jgi:hypothetical protein
VAYISTSAPVCLVIRATILGTLCKKKKTFLVYPSGKQPYEVFLNYGFSDVANPSSKNQDIKVYPSTFGNPVNTWSGDESDNVFTQKLDYIMTLGRWNKKVDDFG